MQRKFLVISILFAMLLAPYSVSAAVPSELKDDRAVLQFPDTITFHAQIESATNIESIVLEYGTNQQTCGGEVIAKAFPQFSPAKSVKVEWTWEMRQSGSLPPGATIWWRWRYTNESGQETVSEQKTVSWLDNIHAWQTVSEGSINLHWYRGDADFAQDLLDAAVSGLARVEKDAGLKAEQPIDLYIYSGVEDLKDAILYEPSWVGGMAFPEHNLVIIGIAPADIAWGRRTEVHELTHVLVGHLTFSCLGDVPTWLNEGLAVYAEGELEPSSQIQLDNAIRNDELFSVRSLSGGFSEVSDKANLSYSESYSIVKFIIEQYGREKMISLLVALRDGNTVDEALQQVYGFDVDGLEDAWRTSIGAKDRSLATSPTAAPTPTVVPTIAPVSGVVIAITPTPLTFPATSTPNSTSPSNPSDTSTLGIIVLILACVCVLAVGLLALAAVLIFIFRSRKGN